MTVVARKLRLLLVVLWILSISLSVIQAEAQEPGKGMLAVIGSDGNLAIYDSNGKNGFQVTTDGKPEQRIYQWPTWSTDGRLAYFGVSTDQTDPYRLRVFVLEQARAGETARVAYTSPDEIFTYAAWAPGDCPTGKCRDLALLFTPADQNGLGVRLVRDSAGKFTDRIIGQAAPFYYSFSPDGQKMLWHRFASQLEIYDIKANKTTLLGDEPGQFQAPMWSPVDDRLLFGIVGSAPDKTDIVIAKGTTRQALLKELESPVSFAWSWDGAKIASVAGFNAVVVTDAASGKTVANGALNPVVAHFWAPQNDRVAFVTVNRQPSGTQSASRSNGSGVYGNNGRVTTTTQAVTSLTWNILDVTSNRVTTLSNFIPTRDMIYYLNFFDQFVRSHSLWSPDGRYLVYGSSDSLGNQSVVLADTRSPGSTTRVASGSLGIWSWK